MTKLSKGSGMVSLSYAHSCTVLYNQPFQQLTNSGKQQKCEKHVLYLFLYLQILILTPQSVPKFLNGDPLIHFFWPQRKRTS